MLVGPKGVSSTRRGPISKRREEKKKKEFHNNHKLLEMKNGLDTTHEKKKRKLAILSVSSLLLVAMVVAAAVGIRDGAEVVEEGGDTIAKSQRNQQVICESAEYKETCHKSLAKASGTSDLKELIITAFNATAEEIANQIKNSTLYHELATDHMTTQVDVPSTCTTKDVPSNVLRQRILRWLVL